MSRSNFLKQDQPICLSEYHSQPTIQRSQAPSLPPCIYSSQVPSLITMSLMTDSEFLSPDPPSPYCRACFAPSLSCRTDPSCRSTKSTSSFHAQLRADHAHLSRCSEFGTPGSADCANPYTPAILLWLQHRRSEGMVEVQQPMQHIV